MLQRLFLVCFTLATVVSAAELEFSSFFGGNMREYGRAAALDDAGNIYVVGDTSSGDLPLVKPIRPLKAALPESWDRIPTGRKRPA